MTARSSLIQESSAVTDRVYSGLNTNKAGNGSGSLSKCMKQITDR